MSFGIPRSLDPFYEKPLHKAHYHPSLPKHVHGREKQHMMSPHREYDDDGDEPRNKAISPEEDAFLRGSYKYTKAHRLARDGDFDEQASPNFDESWPGSERPSSLSFPGSDLVQSPMLEEIQKSNKSRGSISTIFSAEMESSSPHSRLNNIRGLLDFNQGVPDKNSQDRRKANRVGSKTETDENTGGSTLSKYIHRFRHGTPLSKEERDKGADHKDFWWLSSAPTRDSASSPPSSSTPKENDEPRSRLSKRASQSALGNKAKNIPLTKKALEAAMLTGRSAVRANPWNQPLDEESRLLQEKTDQILERTASSMISEGQATSTIGLGTSSTVTSGGPAVSTDGLGTSSTDHTFMSEDTFRPSYVRPRQEHKYPIVKKPVRHEDDVLYQWRLRRKLEDKPVKYSGRPRVNMSADDTSRSESRRLDTSGRGRVEQHKIPQNLDNQMEHFPELESKLDEFRDMVSYRRPLDPSIMDRQLARPKDIATEDIGMVAKHTTQAIQTEAHDTISQSEQSPEPVAKSVCGHSDASQPKKCTDCRKLILETEQSESSFAPDQRLVSSDRHVDAKRQESKRPFERYEDVDSVESEKLEDAKTQAIVNEQDLIPEKDVGVARSPVKSDVPCDSDFSSTCEQGELPQQKLRRSKPRHPKSKSSFSEESDINGAGFPRKPTKTASSKAKRKHLPNRTRDGLDLVQSSLGSDDAQQLKDGLDEASGHDEHSTDHVSDYDQSQPSSSKLSKLKNHQEGKLSDAVSDGAEPQRAISKTSSAGFDPDAFYYGSDLPERECARNKEQGTGRKMSRKISAPVSHSSPRRLVSSAIGRAVKEHVISSSISMSESENSLRFSQDNDAIIISQAPQDQPESRTSEGPENLDPSDCDVNDYEAAQEHDPSVRTEVGLQSKTSEKKIPRMTRQIQIESEVVCLSDSEEFMEDDLLQDLRRRRDLFLGRLSKIEDLLNASQNVAS